MSRINFMHSYGNPLSLRVLPTGMKEKYKRFALVSNHTHVERLDMDDETTLIVSCDWLLWHQLIADGGHCFA